MEMITPQEEQPGLAKALGLPVSLYFKREDMHPYGSHKGRSIPKMIDRYAWAGETKFAISGSGNASLAAAMHICKYNKENPDTPITLQIFFGESINKKKAKRVEEVASCSEHISIETVERPIQTVHKLNKFEGIRALRQSKDETALAGYEELANELKELSPVAIFIPTSSGTTAQALGTFLPDTQIHIVQTTKVHTLSEKFDDNFTPSEGSIADAIVDIVGQRKADVKK